MFSKYAVHVRGEKETGVGKGTVVFFKSEIIMSEMLKVKHNGKLVYCSKCLNKS